jgi:hypothetical protein
MLQIFRMFTLNFTNSVEATQDMLATRWINFIKFSARRFVNSYEMKD